MIGIEPKDICISGPGMPLIGTFSHCEAEWAAALIILACQDRGDFGSTKPSEIGEAIAKHKDDEGFTWMRAMIRDPNFDYLQDCDYIEGMNCDDRTGSVKFTEKGLLTLEESPWMIRTPTEQAAYESAREMARASK